MRIRVSVIINPYPTLASRPLLLETTNIFIMTNTPKGDGAWIKMTYMLICPPLPLNHTSSITSSSAAASLASIASCPYF